MDQTANPYDLYAEKIFAELEREMPHRTRDSIWRKIELFFRSFTDAVQLVGKYDGGEDAIYSKYLVCVYPDEMPTYWDIVRAIRRGSSYPPWHYYYAVEWETNSIIGKEMIPFPKKELYGDDDVDGDKRIRDLFCVIEQSVEKGYDMTWSIRQLAALEEWRKIWENNSHIKPAKQ